ncbi:SdrD B-like domain-containing protein [Aeromicrobium fastidiosum]|uniref:LPXTG cell wall anchor domain-containing protein n=1 Tax=Aeromicrobium fastidiosum TaxID=52699 RepID=A0A641ATB9_9ACTN|nr:SdrD B-like domain-containing protein [Aeromicrobium fastidiosum]KAA1380483.1 LPXTG cell wall anchor domain-containing protein [Aeromicrobium fastidiosum]MBP2390072.1 LPXTG-motif cell wall-anchored protein [Aeromicrobium fastidiosum]
MRLGVSTLLALMLASSGLVASSSVAADDTSDSPAASASPTEPTPTDAPATDEPELDVTSPTEAPAGGGADTTSDTKSDTKAEPKVKDEPKADVPSEPTPQDKPSVAERVRGIVAQAVGDGTLSVDLTQTTGTGPFDGDDAAGHDSSATNNIIRTNDTITYKVGIRYEGEDQTTPKITFSLPKGQELVSLPPFCLDGSSVTPASLPAPTVPLTATSYQSLPTQTVVCVVANQAQGTALNYDFLAKLRPEVPNGTTMGPFAATATSDQVTTPASSSSVSQTVSAKARFDVSKRGSSSNEETGPLYARGAPCTFDSTRACQIYQYPLTITAPAGGKGTSPLVSPITLTDDISPATYYGPTVWAAAVAAAGSEAAAIEKYAPRYKCGATQDLWGSIPWSLIDAGNTSTNSVRDSGDISCTQPGGTGTKVDITITNADTSAYTVPTKSGNGSTLPADTGYVISRQVNLEIPIDAALDLGTKGADGHSWTLATENTYTDIVMTDISGKANSGEVLANNNRKAQLAVQTGEGFNKYFSGVWGRPGNLPAGDFSPGNGLYQGPPGSSQLRDGNTVVVPGQVVQSNIYFSAQGIPNTGTAQSRSYVGCDLWDESKLALTAVSSSASGDGQNSSRASGGNPVWLSFFQQDGSNNHPTSDLKNFKIQYSTGPAGPGASSDCTTGTWSDTPLGVSGASVDANGVFTGINRIRFSFTPSFDNSADLVQLSLAMGMTVKSGSPVGTKLPNWGSFKAVDGVKDMDGVIADPGSYTQSNYVPATHVGAWGDRLTLGGVTARIKKYVKNPTSGQFSDSAVPQYSSGAKVDYRLNPTITADVSAGTKAPVIVEDCLPKYQQFVSSKRVGSGDPITPVLVQTGSPAGAELQCATGETYVKWDLGDNTVNETVDPIVYTVEILGTVRNGLYTNNALVSSEQDPSTIGGRRAQAQIQIVTPTGIKIAKSTPQSIVEVNPDSVATPRTLKWTVDFANVDAPQNVSDVDIIDVLPADGVGDTDFTGSLAFTSATVAAGTGIDIQYTSSPAAGLKVDPNDATNGATGATVWCSAISGTPVSGVGTAADCPTTASAVTGLRFKRAGAFAPGDDMTVNIVMTPSKNAGGDVYDNITSGRANGVSQPVGPASREIAVIESAIGDFVWEDVNKNGVQDAGEPGVAGFPVKLVGKDLDGNPVSLSTTTNANGKYSFKGLASGTYKVIFDPNALTSNTTFTTRDAGSDDALDSDADTATGETAEITLAPDSQDPSWDAGLVIDRNVKIVVDKKVESQSVLDAKRDGTVTYSLTVANSGTAEGTYSLNDQLTFGGDVKVLSATATTTASGVTVNPSYDGLTSPVIVTDQKIAGGATHVYTVTVGVHVDTKIAKTEQDCKVKNTETGTGFLNTAKLVIDDVTYTDKACVPVTPPTDNPPKDKGHDGDVKGGGDSNEPNESGLLPSTGGPALGLLLGGLALVAGGALLVRRRRDETTPGDA